VSDYAVQGSYNDLRRIERASAQRQLADLRHTLGLIGCELIDKGSCLIDEDPKGVIEVASELEATASRLRTIAVELNAATVIEAEMIADEARRGITS
jgi:hypothetical protein